jgi:hypothetical protein
MGKDRSVQSGGAGAAIPSVEKIRHKLHEGGNSFAQGFLKLELLGEEITPFAVFGRTHFFAPDLCRSVFQGYICSHFSLRFGKPHRFASVGLAHRNNKVRIELAGPIVFIVRDGEPEALVFQIAKNIFCAIEKVGIAGDASLRS